MAQVTVDYHALVAGLEAAAKDYDQESVEYMHAYGQQVASAARGAAPRGTGELAGSIGIQEQGRDSKGPYLDVGATAPYAIYVEFGTYKDRAQPFMRPAMGLAAKATGALGGKATRTGARARAFSSRASARSKVRTSLRKGQISSAQARAGSRQISNRLRYRAPRPRR